MGVPGIVTDAAQFKSGSSYFVALVSQGLHQARNNLSVLRTPELFLACWPCMGIPDIATDSEQVKGARNNLSVLRTFDVFSVFLGMRWYPKGLI